LVQKKRKGKGRGGKKERDHILARRGCGFEGGEKGKKCSKQKKERKESPLFEKRNLFSRVKGKKPGKIPPGKGTEKVSGKGGGRGPRGTSLSKRGEKKRRRMQDYILKKR